MSWEKEIAWSVTDPDCAQCLKTIDADNRLFRLVQVNEIGERFGVVSALIDLNDYTADDLKSILAMYGWGLEEPDTLIAEAVFETESLEYEHTFYENYNRAIRAVEEITKLNLWSLRDNPLHIVRRNESEYMKEHNPYFHDNAHYGRDGDTIVLIPLKTPTGKWSKYYGIIQFNAERNIANKAERIAAFKERMETEFKDKLRKGYSLGEIILYSGDIPELGLDAYEAYGLSKESVFAPDSIKDYVAAEIYSDKEKQEYSLTDSKDSLITININDFLDSPSHSEPDCINSFTITKNSLADYLKISGYTETVDEFINKYRINCNNIIDISYDIGIDIYRYCIYKNSIISDDIFYSDAVLAAFDAYKSTHDYNGYNVDDFYLYILKDNPISVKCYHKEHFPALNNILGQTKGVQKIHSQETQSHREKKNCSDRTNKER